MNLIDTSPRARRLGGLLAMANPDALDGPSTVFLSGDDPNAKETVAALLTDLG